MSVYIINNKNAVQTEALKRDRDLLVKILLNISYQPDHFD